MTEGGKAERRVLIALDAVTSGLEDLQGAAQVAATLGADLAVVFVENADLMRWAALPFAREVFYPSAMHREPDVSRIRRSLDRLADTARSRLGELIPEESARWSFNVKRGSVAAELYAALDQADFVLARVSGPIRGARLLVAVHVSNASEEFAEALRGLTERPDHQLQVVILGNDHGGTDKALRAGLAEELRSGRIRILHALDKDELKVLMGMNIGSKESMAWPIKGTANNVI